MFPGRCEESWGPSGKGVQSRMQSRLDDTEKCMFGVQALQSHRQFEPGGDLPGILF